MALDNGTIAIAVGVAVSFFLLGLLVGLALRRKPSDAGVAPAAPAAPPKAPDPFTEGSGSEKRVAARRRGKSVRVLITGVAGTWEPIEGWVVDLSVTGLRLGVGRPIPVGSKIKICAASVTPPVWVEVEITNSKREKSTWFVGGKLLGSPTYKDLWTLG